MVDYKRMLEEANAKGIKAYGEEAWEKAKKSGQTFEGTTPDPREVGLGENDPWTLLTNELAKKFENPLDGYTNGKRAEEISELENQARTMVSDFNNWVIDLEQNTDYSEEGKYNLYQAKRRETENQLKALGDTQHELQVAIGKTRYNSMEKALATLKSELKPSDLSAGDIAYITSLLEKDNSQQARVELASEYNYHLSALKIINAYRSKNDPNSHEILHPLENQLRSKPSLYRLNDFRMGGMGYYTHQVLRNLNNKIIHGFETEGTGKIV